MRAKLLYLPFIIGGLMTATVFFVQAEPVANTVPVLGSWQNQDEDGDGVPDCNDDYPFDPTRSRYPEYADIEPNDSVGRAINTQHELSLTEPGFRIHGKLASARDKTDMFRFKARKGQSITALLQKTNLNSAFEPLLSFAGLDGNALNFGRLTRDVPAHYGIEAITYVVREDRELFLLIADKNIKGGPDFGYTVTLFLDSNANGVDDQQMRAMGVEPKLQSSSGDGIRDLWKVIFAKTCAELDFDGDGVPNILDTDSNGDGIPDRIKGIGDADSDGVPNFLSLDSDGNGIADTEEIGPNPQRPLDSNRNGIPDFLDLDDDGDGLLDSWDNDRLKPIAEAPFSGAEAKIIFTLFGLHGTERAEYYRPGDKVLIRGKGLQANSEDTIIALFGAGSPVNLRPETVTEEGLTFTMPDVLHTSLFVAIGNSRTGHYQLDIKPANSPVIAGSRFRMLSAEEELVITGSGFVRGARVVVNNRAVTPSRVRGNEIRLRLPKQESKGEFFVRGANGNSNIITFEVQQDE